MEAERLIKGYEHEKHQERKRKGAHLEAIFKQAAKKSNQDNNNKDSSRLLNKYSGDEKLVSIRSPEIPPCNTTFEKAATSSRNSLGNNGNDVENVVSSFRDGGNHLGKPRHSPGENGSPSGNSVNPLRNTKNGIVSNGSAKVHVRSLSENKSHDVAYQKDRNSSCASRESEQERSDRTAEENSQGSHYTGFKQIEESSESTGSEFPTSVSIKQEKIDEPPPVQVISTQSQEEGRKSLVQDNGEIGEDCLKFLLFSGKLYRCEKISDLTHGFSRFIGDSVLGRKGFYKVGSHMDQGLEQREKQVANTEMEFREALKLAVKKTMSRKVVVLLLFHKKIREVLNYVVGVVDHYTLEEHNIIIKVIKHHTYPTTAIPRKLVEQSASRLVVGSKKLLYNLQPLNGAVYSELVKVLDGFGANSAVDHAKITEFNAMINANADRLDGQISNVLGRMGFPYRGAFANRNFVAPSYSYIGSGFPQTNPRYSPLATKVTATTRYSPEKCNGGSSDTLSVYQEAENDYQRRLNASYQRDGHHVNTVSANQTVRITPRTANSSIDHIRSASTVPIAPNARFRSPLEDGSLASRNEEDLQTVAELCKERMKRDMAEQELKSIKAAFEEFKSQMQQHLSQVEERMVLLEAENRTLKGNLSNMHQNNGFAEKKYNELRSQLEDLLKSA